MVHQHFKLVDVYTNLENIILGAEWTHNGIILDKNIAIKKIKALQNVYDLHFDLNQKSGDATVSTQQKVEIMKMLFRDNEILVFDEPTAVLTDEEIQGLLKSFNIFKKCWENNNFYFTQTKRSWTSCRLCNSVETRKSCW